MKNRTISKTDGGKGSASRKLDDRAAYREGYARIFGNKNCLTEKDNEAIEGMIDDVKGRNNE